RSSRRRPHQSPGTWQVGWKRRSHQPVPEQARGKHASGNGQPYGGGNLRAAGRDRQPRRRQFQSWRQQRIRLSQSSVWGISSKSVLRAGVGRGWGVGRLGLARIVLAIWVLGLRLSRIRIWFWLRIVLALVAPMGNDRAGGLWLRWLWLRMGWLWM